MKRQRLKQIKQAIFILAALGGLGIGTAQYFKPDHTILAPLFMTLGLSFFGLVFCLFLLLLFQNRSSESVQTKPSTSIDPASIKPKQVTKPPHWTEYTQDMFYDVIWHWHYKTEFDDTPTPRAVKPHCSECDQPLIFIGEQEMKAVTGEKMNVMQWYCPAHPAKPHIVPDKRKFWKINSAIREKIKDGSWEQVVLKLRAKTSK